MTDQLADLLDDTADVIETYGHVKGQGGTTDVGFCIAGALNYVAVERYHRIGVGVLPMSTQEAYVSLARKIGPVFMTNNIDVIFHWNDAEERTAQEVLDLLRETAKELRG